MTMGDALKNDERSIRELVTFVDDELTDEKLEDASARCSARSTPSARRGRRREVQEKLDGTMKGATSKDKRKYRKVRGERMRATSRSRS